MIYNVSRGTFGDTLRMGDLIAVANVIEHFRTLEKNSEIKFYIEKQYIQPIFYCYEFYDWLVVNTNYFSAIPGEQYLPWRNVNLWDYRDISGDLVTIENKFVTRDKVVVCPVYNAKYNVYRNWPTSILNDIVEQCVKQYPKYEKVLLTPDDIQIEGFVTSKRLTDNLEHIMTSKVYIGGDTGLSHFTGALNRGPEPIYWVSSRGLIHTTPINWHTKKKGTLRTYWLDFENTKW